MNYDSHLNLATEDISGFQPTYQNPKKKKPRQKSLAKPKKSKNKSMLVPKQKFKKLKTIQVKPKKGKGKKRRKKSVDDPFEEILRNNPGLSMSYTENSTLEGIKEEDAT